MNTNAAKYDALCPPGIYGHYKQQGEYLIIGVAQWAKGNEVSGEVIDYAVESGKEDEEPRDLVPIYRTMGLPVERLFHTMNHRLPVVFYQPLYGKKLVTWRLLEEFLSEAPDGGPRYTFLRET